MSELPRQTTPLPIDAAAVLDALSVGVLLTDSDGVIVWANPVAGELLQASPPSLVGQGRNTLPARRRLRMSKSAERLRVQDPDGGDRWLECVTESFPGHGPATQLTTITDITMIERRRTRRNEQTDKPDPAQTDKLTGLLNRSAIQLALSGEVARSRRYHNPLTVLLLSVHIGTESNDDIARLDALQAERGLARLLREKLRWVDMIGAWSRGEILIVLPETSAESASQLARKIRAQVRGAGRSLCIGNSQIKIAMTEWVRGDDVASLTRRLESGYKAPPVTPQAMVALV